MAQNHQTNNPLYKALEKNMNQILLQQKQL